VIVVVRHSAKEEPPLRNLAFFPQVDVNNGVGGGEGIIHAIAGITVHGRTVSGRAVSAFGRLTVTFADFAGGGLQQPSPVPSAQPTPVPASPSPLPSPSASPSASPSPKK
jgi:hypothetical protein